MGSKRYTGRCSTRLENCEDGLRERGAFEKFEIYVPKEAEVIVVPEEMLPSSVWNRMRSISSLRKTGGGAAAVSGRTATWISPVVIRERMAQVGDSCSSHDNGMARARLSIAAVASAAIQHCCWLPITCAHLAAFKVLRNFLPLGQDQKPRMETEFQREPASLPTGHTLHFTHDSIVIHGGRIFLSIKSSDASLKRSRGHLVTLQGSSPLAVGHCQNNFRRSLGTRQHKEKTCSHSAIVEPCATVGVKPQDTVVWLQKFGINREVRVVLKRLPETGAERSFGDKMPVSQVHLVKDLNDQMLPSSGSLVEESYSSMNIKDVESEELKEHDAVLDQPDLPDEKHCVESEELKERDAVLYQPDLPDEKHCVESEELKEHDAVLDQTELLDEKHCVDKDEQDFKEPVLKKRRLFHHSVFGLQGSKGGDGDANEAVGGEEDGNMNGGAYREVVSDLRQKQVVEDGQQEVGRYASEEEMKLEYEMKSEEDVNRGRQSPVRSQAGELPTYHFMSRLEDHTAFDFEQLARQERISRIREMIREKEAALKRLEPHS